MTITHISETKRGRFALFSAECFLFSVDEETLVQYDLHEGSSLSDEELSSLEKLCEARRARERALRLLARRAHSEWELRQKLLQYHDEFSVDVVIQDLLEVGFLNDEEFALARAGHLAEQGRSRREIAERLRAVGVGRDDIETAQRETDVDEYNRALQVLQKSYLVKLRAGEREKVIAAMARRGFTQHDVLRALEELEQEYQ